MAAPVTPQLSERFRPEDLKVLTACETRRFLAGPAEPPPSRGGAHLPNWEPTIREVGWELLYRLEPDLYDRLTAGEPLHPSVMQWLPDRIGNAVEVGAGSGRLTVALAPRCRRMLAVEPAQPLARRLKHNLRAHELHRCQVLPGFFDQLPAADGWADLVISYSAFDVDPGHGGLPGLREMDRVLAPSGRLVLVSAADPDWLRSNGFELIDLPGAPAVQFASASEAVELARIFYPHAAGEIARRGLASVPATLIHRGPPRIAVRGKQP